MGNSTAFHVPSAEAVVAGDIVYNNVHMMQAETDDAKREAWIASIYKLAALNPLDEIGQHSIGAAGQADLFALPHHEPVEEFDLGAPAFLHVLAHRRALPGGGLAGILESLLVAAAHRRSFPHHRQAERA